MLLEHFLLDVAALIDKLLLTLNSSSVVVELGVLLTQGVIGGLEPHVLSAGNLVVALLLTLGFQGLQAFVHLFTHLLGRFQVVVEFLFVDAVLGGKELGQTGLSLLKVDSLSAAHVGDAVLHDTLLDHFASFFLPSGFVGQIGVTFDIIHHACMFL